MSIVRAAPAFAKLGSALASGAQQAIASPAGKQMTEAVAQAAATATEQMAAKFLRPASMGSLGVRTSQAGGDSRTSSRPPRLGANLSALRKELGAARQDVLGAALGALGLSQPASAGGEESTALTQGHAAPAQAAAAAQQHAPTAPGGGFPPAGDARPPGGLAAAAGLGLNLRFGKSASVLQDTLRPALNGFGRAVAEDMKRLVDQRVQAAMDHMVATVETRVNEQMRLFHERVATQAQADRPAGAASPGAAIPPGRHKALQALGLTPDANWSQILGVRPRPPSPQALAAALAEAVAAGDDGRLGAMGAEIENDMEAADEAKARLTAQFKDHPAWPEIEKAVTESAAAAAQAFKAESHLVEQAQSQVRSRIEARRAAELINGYQRTGDDADVLRRMGQPANASAHQILNIGPGASESEIKAAYKKLALRYHPDKNQDESVREFAEKAFKVVDDVSKALLSQVV